jgi:putative endonuclease
MGTRTYYVYIATNRCGTLYVGVTNDVEKRMRQHREGTSEFTAQFRIGKLVYVEVTDDVWAALAREKQIKGWTRAKKLALIRTTNPAMRDLSAAGYYWRHGVEVSKTKESAPG